MNVRTLSHDVRRRKRGERRAPARLEDKSNGHGIIPPPARVCRTWDGGPRRERELQTAPTPSANCELTAKTTPKWPMRSIAARSPVQLPPVCVMRRTPSFALSVGRERNQTQIRPATISTHQTSGDRCTFGPHDVHTHRAHKKRRCVNFSINEKKTHHMKHLAWLSKTHQAIRLPGSRRSFCVWIYNSCCGTHRRFAVLLCRFSYSPQYIHTTRVTRRDLVVRVY